MTRNFTDKSKIEILLRTATCQAEGCNTPLADGVEWDHRIPWAISKDRSAKNGDALCPTCHAKKTNKESFGGKSDKSTIAKCKRVHRKHTGDIKPKGNIPKRKLEGGGAFPKRKFNSSYVPNIKYLDEPLPEIGDPNGNE